MGSRSVALNFEQELQLKLKAVNLTSIASGVTQLGHLRARLRERRKTPNTPGAQGNEDASKRITERLALAQDAEDASRVAVLRSWTEAIRQDKLRTLVAAGMIFPVTLAVEINNYNAEIVGLKLVMEGIINTLPFLRIVLPCKLALEDGDDDPFKGVDHVDQYNWEDPRACLVPGDVDDVCARFEASMFSHFLTPLLRKWSNPCSPEDLLSVINDVDRQICVGLNDDVAPQINACVNLSVTCLRCTKYAAIPTADESYLSDYEQVENAVPAKGAWKGLLYNFWILLNEVAMFKPMVLSIKATRVTHKVAIQDIKAAEKILKSEDNVFKQRDELMDFVKHLKTTRDGARAKSTVYVDQALPRLGNLLVDEVFGFGIRYHTHPYRVVT